MTVTDDDLIGGHPFQPHPVDPSVCGWAVGGDLPCGFGRDEHVDPGVNWPPDDDDEHRGHHRELWDETAARAEQDDDE